MKKYTAALFISLLTSIFTALLYPAQTNETLRIGIQNFPAAVNPLYAMDEISQSIVNKVFDSLFYFDSSGKLQNGLVESYLFHCDDKKITLRLKKNVFFSNGNELDAHDVRATLERVKDPRFQSPYISKLKFIRGFEEVDKYALAILLNEPPVTWKKHLTFKILNAEELAPCTPEGFRHKILAGTGAYRIARVTDPSKITLELNDTGDAASMYRIIEYRVVAYTQLAPLKLLNNELDICELQPIVKDTYAKRKEWREKFTLLEYKKFGYTYLVFNLRNPELTSNVRKIFYNLLVCGDFLDRFLRGKGERVHTPFLLLNRKTGATVFTTHPLEKPLHLKFLCNSESKIRKEFVLFLKNELKPFNIHISPLFLEYHTFLSRIKKSRFDMAVSGFLLDIGYDMKDIFHSGSYFNYARFEHPGMDRLLESGLKEFDPVKREAIYLKTHRIWLEELPLIPLFSLYYYVGISNRINIPENVSTLVGAEGDFLFNIRQWKMK